jgi:hypothetical protein
MLWAMLPPTLSQKARKGWGILSWNGASKSKKELAPVLVIKFVYLSLSVMTEAHDAIVMTMCSLRNILPKTATVLTSRR